MKQNIKLYDTLRLKDKSIFENMWDKSTSEEKQEALETLLANIKASVRKYSDDGTVQNT